MASTKISDMTAATDLVGAVVPIVQGGVNKKAASTLFSGSPSGNDTEVQFNDGGSFGGDPGLTYNKTTNVLTADGFVVNGETASRVAIIDASKNVKSADTATYPSLTELSYVKGVTSSIQTQINALGGVDADEVELAYLRSIYYLTIR